MEPNREIKAGVLTAKINKTNMVLLLALFWLIPYAGVYAQRVPNVRAVVDTNSFVDEFCNYAWEQIDEELSEPYNLIHGSGVGFEGITITAFQLKNGVIQDVSFSKDMPDSFKKGIANALGDAILILKGKNKVVINGNYLLPIQFTIDEDRKVKRRAYKTVSDFISDNMQYQSWYRLPLNSVRVDYN